MGAPDILGTYGVFSLFTSDTSAFAGQTLSGGAVHYVDASAGVVRGTLEGPDQPYLTHPEKMTTTFAAYVDATRQFVKISAGGEERLLRVGEWTDWVPLTFAVASSRQWRRKRDSS